MKYKIIAAVAVAAGLALGAASPAAASPLGHKPAPKTVAQVTGKQLATAMLPASDVGSGYASGKEADTGKQLQSSHASQSVSSMSCSDLGDGYAPNFGQTAAASDEIGPSGDALPPSGSPIVVVQAVSQFATTAKAWSFFTGEQAKYQSCQSYNSSISDGSSGTTSVTVNLQNTGWTKVGSYSAFTVSQVADVSDSSGGSASLYLNATVVSTGTNVYMIWVINQASDPVPSWWLSTLIKKTLTLYKTPHKA